MRPASSEERGVTEGGQDDRDVEVSASVCGICGTPHQPGDRFCAQCGASLTASTRAEAAATPPTAIAAPSPPTGSTAEPGQTTGHDPSAWVFAASPGVVAGGGLLLILLAALLLAVGQLDNTGTIVMLSFCAAPLGLIVIAIGIIRFLLRKRGDG
jgi:hypothetical protein